MLTWTTLKSGAMQSFQRGPSIWDPVRNSQPKSCHCDQIAYCMILPHLPAKSWLSIPPSLHATWVVSRRIPRPRWPAKSNAPCVGAMFEASSKNRVQEWQWQWQWQLYICTRTSQAAVRPARSAQSPLAKQLHCSHCSSSASCPCQPEPRARSGRSAASSTTAYTKHTTRTYS
jgi:hypothetical protein